MATIDLSPLEGVVFQAGAHAAPDEGMCVMEAVAWLMGERHSAVPLCVPEDIAFLAQWVNDRKVWDSDEQRTEALRPCIPRMLKAPQGDVAKQARAKRALDLALQTFLEALIRLDDRGALHILRGIPIQEWAVRLEYVAEIYRLQDRTAVWRAACAAQSLTKLYVAGGGADILRRAAFSIGWSTVCDRTEDLQRAIGVQRDAYVVLLETLCEVTL